MNNNYLDRFIFTAIAEDLGDGDHTSLACIPSDAEGKAQLIIKEKGILAGIEIAFRIFKKVDPVLEVNLLLKDGAEVNPGEIALIAGGRILSILQAERLVLNIVQRMSGIATATRRYVSAVKGLHTKILDTRKTTPGMRFLEKMAVRTGGGENHRWGLYDMILIKDNHIDFAGSIETAIRRVTVYLTEKQMRLPVVVEARSLADVREIIRVGNIDRILLDNFKVGETREAVGIIGGRYKTESSGGITLENIRDYAVCGVDYISVGALTHQISSLDMSLKAIE